jgi:hypothetical protein
MIIETLSLKNCQTKLQKDKDLVSLISQCLLLSVIHLNNHLHFFNLRIGVSKIFRIDNILERVKNFSTSRGRLTVADTFEKLKSNAIGD